MKFDGQKLPKWDDETSPEELASALSERRFKDADEQVKALLAELEERPRKVPTKTATRVLAILRAHAWFDQLHAVAQKFGDCGQDDVEVHRQLAQACIEQRDVTQAIEQLLQLQKSIEEEMQDEDLIPPEVERLKWEMGEVMGLLGRSYKQLYVDAKPTRAEPRRQDLDRALEFYGGAYRKGLGDYLWHGVNYIALLTHAKRIQKGKPAVGSKEAEEHAQKILAAIDAKERAGGLQVWDLPNRAECYLAQGENGKALEALQGYLEDAGIMPFNIQSTRRQLQQLWMLNEEAYPGEIVLPMMNARLAELGPGTEEMMLDPAAAKKYERVWGDTGYQPLQFLQKAIERARCVARLGPDQFEGWGTGFLFDGAWIGPSFEGRHLLLTNAHVVSNDPKVQAQVPHPKGPEEQTAVFLGAGEGAKELLVQKLLWTSPPDKLDATLLEIEAPPEGSVPPPLAAQMPATEGDDARVNVIGHPKGFSVRVSLQDNQMVSVEKDPYIHYRTPTDPGSSGSPVFNQKWELVALHHASSAGLSANEGVRMDRLLEAMKKDLL